MVSVKRMIASYRLALLVAIPVLGLLVLLFAVPLPQEKLNPPQAYRFYDHKGRMLATLISEDEFYRMHVPFQDISPLFIESLLLQEDQYFYRHFGVNPFSIVRAAMTNLSAGEVVSGGSTLTMQLARMLERRKRTYWSKIIEAFRALQLEMRYSKEEILAYYLALAPYGGNIEGLEAASRAYFGKPATALSPGEIALFIALPKSPNRYRPDRHPEAARLARDRVLKKMFAAGLITEDQFQRARNEPVAARRKRVDNLIPHTAWHFRLQQPGHYVWHTTIDENIQRRVQGLLKSYVKTLEQYNIGNAAAVVMDTATREVRAVVGSLDYFSIEAQGANDGSRSPRSPGSTLKPFLYALALQQGVIAERTILYDIPINYAGYSPRNYSKDFVGPVSAREALTESLNVVAVRLSKQLGVKALHGLLKQGGITTLDQSASYYGLPLVLGGVEVRLIDLVNLYASLANGGLHNPYRLLSDDRSTVPETRLLSKEASWLVTQILTDVERPDFPQSWQFSKHRPTIAWKTGTSYGHQDAWSVGYTPEYTIGVWVGNFDGAPSNGLAGSKTAAPILFDLFQALQPRQSGQWFARPETVKQRKVCTVSGLPPSRHCDHLVTEHYIANVDGPVLSQICDVHQSISVDPRTGTQASLAGDRPSAVVQQQVFDIWPPMMATFLLKHGVPVRRAPPYDVTNMAGQKYYPPKILSPVKNTIHYQRLDKLKHAEHGIKLAAAVTNRVRKVYWFLDDELVSATDPMHDVIINPGPGEYHVTLMDDVGGTDDVKLLIKDYRELDRGEH